MEIKVPVDHGPGLVNFDDDADDAIQLEDLTLSSTHVRGSHLGSLHNLEEHKKPLPWQSGSVSSCIKHSPQMLFQCVDLAGYKVDGLCIVQHSNCNELILICCGAPCLCSLCSALLQAGCRVMALEILSI